jgi:hypothetical protein
MTNILQLSIETAKRDLMSESLLYCGTCGKPRVKGDYNSKCWCSYECRKTYRKTYEFNYCLICGEKIDKLYYGYIRCSQECLNKNMGELWKKINA